MTATISGIYKDGRVELLETPSGLREGHVQVTLSEIEAVSTAPRPLQYGKYTHGRMSTEDDFLDAEWRGEAEMSNE